MSKQLLSLNEVRKHIPVTVTPEMKDFAIEEVFAAKRYIFTTRQGKHQHGHCTYCWRDFPTEGLRHNEMANCPKCKSLCTVKASGLGRKRLVDEAYFTYYLKSAIDPKAIAAVGIYAVRNFSGDYRGVKTKFMNQALYVFRAGIGGIGFRQWLWYSTEEQKFLTGYYTRMATVRNQFNRDHNAHIFSAYSRKSIAAAVKGTPFGWSGWEQYDDIADMTEFFDLFARYPCVEYLTKLGFKHLVRGKITGASTYSAINWRGKTMARVFRLTGAQLEMVRKEPPGAVTFPVLRLLQLGRKDGSNLTFAEASELSRNLQHYYNDLMKPLPYGSLRKIYAYLRKQMRKGRKTHYTTLGQVLTAWRDYLADCRQLEFDLALERVVFPANLYRAHQNTIKQVKVKADELLNRKIRARAAKLKDLCFEHEGLLIRPAESTEELIAEGKALHHCVGTYAQRYAEGRGDLFVIRQADNADKPFFTAEIFEGYIRQCYGLKNCPPDKTVQTFLDAFKSERLEKKPAKTEKRGVAI